MTGPRRKRRRKRMTASTPSLKLGRHVFGAATFASGLITLAWHNANSGHRLHYVVLALAVAQIAGGALIQFRGTTKTGALVCGAAYLVSALQCVPQIVTVPKVYISWGNFFEQLSLFTGAVLVYASLTPVGPLHRIGRILLGMCAASFALEQALYIRATAELVPKWIPPSQ